MIRVNKAEEAEEFATD